MSIGFVVTETIRNAHRSLYFDYPLLPDDLLVKQLDGTYTKVAPGLAVGGFTLTDEQAATLREVEYGQSGLNYWTLEKKP